MPAPTETMAYFKRRMRMLRAEYTRADRTKVIAAAGNECSMCERRSGDIFEFGPTHYLKKKIRFKVYIDVHVIEGGPMAGKPVVLCGGCHVSYHLLNRLSEDAEFGGTTISKTIYRRCPKCNEMPTRRRGTMACMCCKRHNVPRKDCGCVLYGEGR